jgi:hypothetical protein
MSRKLFRIFFHPCPLCNYPGGDPRFYQGLTLFLKHAIKYVLSAKVEQEQER